MRGRSVLLCLVLAFSGAAFGTDADKEKLKQTLTNLAKSKQVQAQLLREQTAVEKELELLQNKATALAQKLQQSEQRVSTQEDALTNVNVKLTSRQKEFAARKADYAATVVTMLRLRRLPLTSMLTASADQFETLVRTAAVLEKTNQALAQKARALKADMETLSSLRGEAANRKALTSKETTQLVHEQATLEKALVQRQSVFARLENDRARTDAQVEKLSKESQSLQELLTKLEAQAREREPTPVRPKKSMAKGGMNMPVSGDILHRFGESKNAIETYRGTTIRTRNSATVVAPGDGHIVFTGPFRDYGTMILIKHPGGYISLVAGVGKLSSSTGQQVKKGEPIAAMPSSGVTQAYVELRDSSAKPIDPTDWFASVKK